MENKQLTQQQKQLLLNTAQEARKRAYAPYSHFMVGAALMGESGKVYTGCNVENASYPAGLCAERSAVAQGISQGEQRFAAIAITGGGKGQESPLGPAYPCGICRQVLLEFLGTHRGFQPLGGVYFGGAFAPLLWPGGPKIKEKGFPPGSLFLLFCLGAGGKLGCFSIQILLFFMPKAAHKTN